MYMGIQIQAASFYKANIVFVFRLKGFIVECPILALKD